MVPIVIAFVCFLGGLLAASRWLPDLADGRVAGISFFLVCGLVGAAVAVVGVDVYGIVRSLELRGFGERSIIVASQLTDMLRNGGTLFALAALVYLVAPSRCRDAGLATE
jgi:hypothetical protein